MKITPQNIEEQGFELLEKVELDNYEAFVKKMNWNNSKLHYIYKLCIGLAVILTLFLIIRSYEIYFFKILYALLGVVLAIVLILAHEVIHYVMYVVFGAQRIKIVRFPNKDYLLTIAHHFLVGKREIPWIAIMPYVVITTFCLVPILFVDDLLQILLSSTILFHTTMCKEDFRIIHYFYTQKSEVKMYTDIEKATTYFFKRIDSSL